MARVQGAGNGCARKGGALMLDLTNLKPNPDADQKAWARWIIARHEAGEAIRPITLRFAREALKVPKSTRPTETEPENY